MNYNDTVNWMFRQLPMYQQVGAVAYKKDLGNTHLLLDYLGHPEQALRCIHVAGTNGKGSTSHLLASVLQEAGYKTGLYTSPHLKDFRERIKIDGAMISETFVVDFIKQHRNFFEQHELSFFEMSVGLAFEYFKEMQVDIAVIETGMGGRLDATNVITPLISVITNIGLDHTAFLGNTLALIAAEKAGIIKPKVPVVIGEYTADTKAVFETKAQETQSAAYYASDLIGDTYPSALVGNYQFHNKKTALQTLRVLQVQKEFIISEAQIKNGFLKVIDNTGLLGRWQQLGEHPKVIADTAHNAEGLCIVMAQIAEEKYEHLHLVLGVVNDKDLDVILPIFPKNAIYYFCRPDIPRGLDAGILMKKAFGYGLLGAVYTSVSAAYKTALTNADTDDFVYVGGSTFVVAEIL